MKTNKRIPGGPLMLLASGALLTAFCLLQPSTVKAQWTTPDPSQNINNTNTGNVGIGTTTPGSLLEVKKSQSAATSITVDNPFTTSGNAAYSSFVLKQAGVLRFHIASVNDNHNSITPGTAQIWNFANAPMVFATNSTERMRISSSGDVGIGTTAPGALLDLASTTQINNRLLFSGQEFYLAGNTSTSGVALRLGVNRAGERQLWFADSAQAIDATNAQLVMRFFSGTVGLAALSTDGTNGRPLLLQSAGGNVGIGTATPSRRLELVQDVGGISFEAGTGSPNSGVIRFGDNTGWKFHFGRSRDSNGGALNSGTSGVLMTIQDNGNVGIGTVNPSYKLDVAGEIRSSTGGFRFPDGSIQTTAASGSGAVSSVFGRTGAVVAATNDYTWAQINKSVSSLADLTTRSAGDLSSGTLPDARFPAILPTVSGANLTNLNASNLANGTVSTARLGSGTANSTTFLRGDNTWAVPSGGSQWTTSGSNVYYNTGNVGLGTDAPFHKLEIAGSGSVIGFAPGNTSSYGNNAVLNRIVARSNYGAVDSSSAAEIKFLTGSDAWYKGSIAFFTNDVDSTASAAVERMRISNAGNVGIGTTTPGAKLEVVGNVNVTGTGNITAAGTIEGGNIKAKYQDVAEWVESSQELPAGTVVVLDPTKSNQVIASSQAYDTRVAGVISERPGIALGEAGDNKVLVATTGRVRLTVDASKGPIQIGDLLVTSDTPGVAMKSQPINVGGVQIHRPGTIIGKALESLAKGSGEILALLSLQ